MTMGANVFNLQPNLHIRAFSLGEYNLSSTSGTRVYIDLDIPETAKFKDHLYNTAQSVNAGRIVKIDAWHHVW
ncbi:hypothetical protein SO802_005670 [Lithocarpus litseifolius]|uniref:Uncharacterized protein n=1 Tax=Lithocarpus litseifolius TaxID=425828 RepID=A0AAW2DLC7_9ROSI